MCIGVNSPTEHIHKLRVIKSEAEVDLMRTAGVIASKAFHEVSLPALSFLCLNMYRGVESCNDYTFDSPAYELE